MNVIDVDLNIEQILEIDRFILTQVIGTKAGVEQCFTLVFPATWVAEILRVDRSQILKLPFYHSSLIGVIDRGGQITPLIAAAHCLEVQPSLGGKLMVVRLNEANEELGNVGLIVDRLIGTTTRQELSPDLFTVDRAGEMVLMRSTLISPDIWQPQYKLSSRYPTF
jgi:chemotaxis signal transduction protein